jgi:hypothetical protein
MDNVSKPIFQFGNVVVVDKDQIGLICKTWSSSMGDNGVYNYDVYVRNCNSVINYQESEIKHFVYSKELTEDELEFYE